jgi:hypothetical protein
LRVLSLIISTTLKPVTNDGSDEEFELPDVISESDVDDDSPQAVPTPEGGLLTPRSNTLGTATLGSDTGSLVTDMSHFFDEFENEAGEKMRRCKACV